MMTVDEALQIVESPMYKTADSRQEAVETLRHYVAQMWWLENSALNVRDKIASGPYSSGQISACTDVANYLAAAREGRDARSIL